MLPAIINSLMCIHLYTLFNDCILIFMFALLTNVHARHAKIKAATLAYRRYSHWLIHKETIYYSKLTRVTFYCQLQKR